MRTYKVLIAIFSLLFVISGTGLLLLVMDDKKDLSSRASTGTPSYDNQNIKPIPESLPSAGQFNPDWSQVEDDLYLNTKTGDTLRVLNKNSNSASVSAILGNTFVKKREVENISIGNTSLNTSLYTFLGDERKVSLWKTQNLQFLEIANPQSSSDATKIFINQIIDATKNKKVLGISTPDNWAKIATLTRSSVVTVFNEYCSELKFFSLPDFPLSDKTYPFCLISSGSGFFVSEDGLLATNGHIVKNLPKSSIYYALSSNKLDNLLQDFLEVYLPQKTGQPVSKQSVQEIIEQSKSNKDGLYQIGGLIIDLYNKNILKITNETNKYYLQLNSTPAIITDQGITETDTTIAATYIDADFSEASDQDGFTSSDVAILKASKPGSYPALPIGSIEDAVVGSELEVVGFPAAATGTKALLDSSITEPTFTKGLVSAIKLAKGNQKKLIQTDAIINHGNSGGPALLSTGAVVGIATYGVVAEDGAGSYNFLRDVQDLLDLAQKNNLQLSSGALYKQWQSALNDYYLGYYKYSTEKFEKIKNEYPQHPLVEKYLSDSESKMNTVEDGTPLLTVDQRQILIKVSTLSMISSFVFTLLFIILLKRKSVSISLMGQTQNSTL